MMDSGYRAYSNAMIETELYRIVSLILFLLVPFSEFFSSGGCEESHVMFHCNHTFCECIIFPHLKSVSASSTKTKTIV